MLYKHRKWILYQERQNLAITVLGLSKLMRQRKTFLSNPKQIVYLLVNECKKKKVMKTITTAEKTEKKQKQED